MKFSRLLLLTVAAWLLPLIMFSVPAHAEPVTVQISGLSTLSRPSILALDFIDGDGPSNVVSTTGFVSDGAISTIGTTGAITGSPLSGFTFADSRFFDEVLLLLTGVDSLTFSFEASAAAPSGFADAFSLFLLDATSGLPALDTTDPSGAGALLLHTIDGSPSGQLQVFQPINGETVWSVQIGPGGGNVAEPGTLALVLSALLIAAGLRRPFHRSVGVVVAITLMGSAQAADLTASVEIARSGFVLNRVTNTFDTQVTVTNKSTDTLVGPLQLVLNGVSPANVAMYNSYGKTAAGKDYVAVPLSTGVLAPGTSSVTLVKLINAGQVVAQADFALLGDRMSAATSTLLDIHANFAAGASGDQPGVPVGAGFVVKVDGVVRGETGADGTLRIAVPIGATGVDVSRPPSLGGSAMLGTLGPGQTVPVQVLVDDGKEIYNPAILRFDQVQQGVLSRAVTAVSLRFLDDERPVRLASLNWVSLTDIVGNMTVLTDLFKVQADGTVSVSPAAFFQAMAGRTGKLTLTIDGNDANGGGYNGSSAFYLADYRVRAQLVAPPSNPTLPLAGVRVTAAVLNTDVRFDAQSDGSGQVVLPDMPAGNLSFAAMTSANGIVYTGSGSVPIGGNSLVKLTMRAPQDVLNNVPPISVGPLPTGVLGVPSGVGQAAANSSASEVAERKRRALSAAPIRAVQVPRATAATSAASVNVSAASQNVIVEDSASLTVKKGAKKLTLKYTVHTAEYPYYVQQQSIYNDVWSLSVLSGNGSMLFDITRQINSQLYQDPIWQADGSTGEIKREIDVSGLTASADVELILRATAVNIGDDALATSVAATLETAEPLIINQITPSAMPAGTANDGSYYSIPRTGAANMLARTFKLDISKPSGSTLTAVNVELRDAAGKLMAVMEDTTPGTADVKIDKQDDTSATLTVRGTVSQPASTVAGTPPPTRDLAYRFTVKGKDESGNDLQYEKDLSGKRALWRMPDGLGRYGSRDAGYDDWAARGTYNWLVTNGTLVRQINDISGEHGRNLGHQAHARGTDIDMFHFYVFPGVTTGPGGGAANHTALLNDVMASFQTLGPNPPLAATQAFGRVGSWLAATRDGLSALAAVPSVSQLIHCRGAAAQGLAAGWCNTLLRSGSVSRTVTGSNGQPQTQTLTFGGAYSNAKMVNNNVHDDHIHVTLNPGKIGE